MEPPLSMRALARCGWLIAGASILSCAGPGGPVQQAGLKTGATAELPELEQGLVIELNPGVEADEPGTQSRVVAATALTDEQAAAIARRLPKIDVDADDRQSFAFRAKSQPPPRTGVTVASAFPADANGEEPPATEQGALQVVRYAPRGDVELAPHVSVTFSKPMVAITSQTVAATNIPVQLTPQPQGQWRWIGTRTILFEPAVRLPQATAYTLQVAEGTRAADGSALSKALNAKFSTPAPVLQRQHPVGDSQRLQPVIFLGFDQRIDPTQLVEHVVLRVGGQAFAVRLAEPAEIAADVQAKALVDAAHTNALDGRHLLVVPKEPLPYDSKVTVVVKKGAPSQEGPRLTERDQTFGFATHGPLKLQETRCAWSDECEPGREWRLTFSNALDLEAFDAALIRIEPELPGMRADAIHNAIVIRGQSKGRTMYNITLGAGLRDAFGQTLGRDVTTHVEVGSAGARLWGSSGMVILDPSRKRSTFDVFSINETALRVEVHAVEPADWSAFMTYMQNEQRNGGAKLPGRPVLKKTIQVERRPDEMVETSIDLDAAFKSGLGHAVVRVESTRRGDRWKPILSAWVQATDIGLDAFRDDESVLVWTNRLSDGKPLGDVEVRILNSDAQGATSAQGTVSMPLPRASKRNRLLIARRGHDSAFLPEHVGWWNRMPGWDRRELNDELRWFVYDDRQMYRPGETVRLKGWIRSYQPGKHGDIQAAPRDLRALSYTVVGSRGNELHKGRIQVNALGGFNTEFKLPDTPNLGWARVQFARDGAPAGSWNHVHSFQIQEFRRPEFEVATNASAGPYLVQEHASVTAKAAYYAGGVLANAPVHWEVTSSPGTFRPPGHDEYVFGRWRPWWEWHHPGQDDLTRRQSLEGTTDAAGKHTLDLAFRTVHPPQPMSVVAQAAISDVNRQTWTSAATLLVHPSDHYVGMKHARYFVGQGEPIEVELIAVDQQGGVLSGRSIHVEAVRLDWAFRKGEWQEVEADRQTCDVNSGDKAQSCPFKTPEGGQYRITARVRDDKGRPNETTFVSWVAGGKQPPSRDVEQERVTLIPDKEEYAPGDAAKLLVIAPFENAQGLLTVRRSGLVSTQRFSIDGTSTTLQVPIGNQHFPNVHVQVDLVGAATRVDDQGKPQQNLPKRTAFASGEINLKVPPRERSLALKVAAAEARLEPGGHTELAISVKDARGKPVASAELAVVVVDEAVLALNDYQTPDPLAAFYTERPAGVSDHHNRHHMRLARPDDASLDEQEADMAGGFGVERKMARARVAESRLAAMAPAAAPNEAALDKVAGAAIALRQNFDALAVFTPSVKTDMRGHARVRVKLPDNLTRYRVMVAAVSGAQQFGSGESAITARLPLMVRASPPRFLNFGDRFELPVVIQNQTDDPLDVQIGLRTTNLALTAGRGRAVRVPANDRVEVRFPAAAELPGHARLQVAAVAGRFADASEHVLPVWTPATTEAFATYGSLEKTGAVRQPVERPQDTVKEYGGLDVSTSSTQLQALTDALLYLVDYPFECGEQVASRILGVVSLWDVLDAFKAEGLPNSAEIRAAVTRDLKKLSALQLNDGGFGLWHTRDRAWPYVSIHAAHALVRAKAHGIDVPAAVWSRAHDYLKHIEQKIPSHYSARARHSLVAYALYVRMLAGDRDVSAASRLLQVGLKKLSPETKGWLLAVLAQERAASTIYRDLENSISETAATATFAGAYQDGAHLIMHSSRRDDAVILDALLRYKPKSDLVEKVTRGLLAQRTRGRWRNTQETVFVLLALEHYFKVYEKVTPNFIARVWLGDKAADEQRFSGRDTKRHHVHIPMAQLDPQQDLVIGKQGKGRLYYRIGLTYAPTDLKLAAADHGFAVERVYEAVDHPADVKRDGDGTWRIKAGARVRVRLTMVAEARRYHVALVDPLPAGLEPLNPALAVTGELPSNARSSYWSPYWYEHQNMRDERVEAFASTLWAGVHAYTYIARATTPGTFVVPPTKAEEMYFPETFGRSATDKVIIE